MRLGEFWGLYKNIPLPFALYETIGAVDDETEIGWLDGLGFSLRWLYRNVLSCRQIPANPSTKQGSERRSRRYVVRLRKPWL